MITRMAWRSAWLALSTVVVVWLSGCGLSLDYLQCGAKCDDASVATSTNGGGSDGSSGLDSGGNALDGTTQSAETSSSSDVATSSSNEAGVVDVVDAVST